MLQKLIALFEHDLADILSSFHRAAAKLDAFLVQEEARAHGLMQAKASIEADIEKTLAAHEQASKALANIKGIIGL
jgi:ABC-type transporter Mla subunit MlaD